MCLGIPGEVTAWIDRDPLFARAMLDFGGIRKECSMVCVPEAEVGDFVIVHAGIAIARLNSEQAAETLAQFSKLPADEEEA